MTMKQIGLIGLGLLGNALADRLCSQSFPVLGHDIDPERCQWASQLGIDIRADPREVYRACERLLLCLPDGEIVAKVIMDLEREQGQGKIVIDTTTAAPAQMETISQRLAQKGTSYLDASVAGSSALAREGNVILFVGGEAPAFEKCADLWQALSRKAFHVGTSGSGARLKLVHNLLLGLHRAVLAEGLHFADHLGLDLVQALSILKQTVAHSRVMDLKGEKMIQRELSPQATLSQHHKDVRLMLAEADSLEIALPLTKLHEELLGQAEELGFGMADNSAIIAAFRRRKDE